MKIASIDIKEFQQFKKDLHLDLTYPKGHEKAEEPLDKVCIIGQSGTGKTSLLNLIHFRTSSSSDKYLLIYKKNKITYFDSSGKKHIVDNYNERTVLEKYPTTCYILPLYETGGFNSTRNKVFKENEINDLWRKNLSKYKEHAIERSKYIFAISNFVDKLSSNDDIVNNREEINRLKREKDLWEKNNPNPLSDIAAFLDPIIAKFGLKIRTDIYNLGHIEFIPIMDKNENNVRQQQWSTGTNQIIYRTYPLFDLKPKNTIILIDEPENSLYPDIQTEIIEHYTRLAPTSQFFFATHSPIIASCFEPWEIVELKFNEDGEVYRDKYYKGENHVDNYFVDPRYLSIDSILLNIFDLKGNINPFRHKQLTELAKIDEKLQQLKQNGKSPENVEKIETLIKEYNSLAEKLDWEIN